MLRTATGRCRGDCLDGVDNTDLSQRSRCPLRVGGPAVAPRPRAGARLCPCRCRVRDGRALRGRFCRVGVPASRAGRALSRGPPSRRVARHARRGRALGPRPPDLYLGGVPCAAYAGGVSRDDPGVRCPGVPGVPPPSVLADCGFRGLRVLQSSAGGLAVRRPPVRGPARGHGRKVVRGAEAGRGPLRRRRRPAGRRGGVRARRRSALAAATRG